MKIVKLLSFLCLLTINCFSQKTEIQIAWQNANASYSNAQYEQAIQQYKSVLDKGANDAIVYYNMGNAYFKMGDRAQSSAHYLRALRLNPNLKQAKDNFRLVQSQIVNGNSLEKDFFLSKWYQSIVHLLVPNTWAWLAATLLVALLAMFMLRKKWKIKYFNRWFAFGCSLIVIIFMLSLIAWKEFRMHNTAVVLTDNVFLYDRNIKEKVLLKIPAGTLVELEGDTTNMRAQDVTLSNGITGWMDPADLEKI